LGEGSLLNELWLQSPRLQHDVPAYPVLIDELDGPSAPVGDMNRISRRLPVGRHILDGAVGGLPSQLQIHESRTRVGGRELYL
jgi:hypothetical protein